MNEAQKQVLRERDEAIAKLSADFVAQFCGGSESVQDVLTGEIFGLFEQFQRAIPDVEKLREQIAAIIARVAPECAQRLRVADEILALLSGWPAAPVKHVAAKHTVAGVEMWECSCGFTCVTTATINEHTHAAEDGAGK